MKETAKSKNQTTARPSVAIKISMVITHAHTHTHTHAHTHTHTHTHIPNIDKLFTNSVKHFTNY